MDDEYYEIETLEDSSESFDRLKKHAQKAPTKFQNWRFEDLPFENKMILYKLDTSKGSARVPVSLEIVQKEVLDVNIYAEGSKLDFDDINKIIGVNLRQFTSQTIDQLLIFFDDNKLVKGEHSQPTSLNEEEKHHNLALFFGNDAHICRFCFVLEENSEQNFHPYTTELKTAFEQLTLLSTKHKKAPTNVCDSCIKQLLQAHEARKNFITSDKTLQECSQVIVVNSTGQSSSALQMKSGKFEDVIIQLKSSNNSSGSEENTGTRPSILKQRPRKIAKR